MLFGKPPPRADLAVVQDPDSMTKLSITKSALDMSRLSSNSSIEVHRLPIGRVRPFMESADASVIKQAKKYLQQAFDDLLAEDDGLARIVHQMKRLELQAVVFGGWARDRLMEMLFSREFPSRDIDLVAHGKMSVARALPDNSVLNHFGGFGLRTSRMHVDAWNLQDTFLIQRHRMSISFDVLPLTADYTANSVVFKPSQFFMDPQIVDRGAVNAMMSGTLEFAADEVAQPLVQAARAVILAVRLGFEPSSMVRSFVTAVCSTKESQEAVAKGIRDFCPEPWADSASLLLKNIIKDLA